MPTSLEEPRTPGAPVVKRTALGQHFIGALVNVEQRPIMKRNAAGVMEPALKADNKPRQELVLTLIAMPGTTAPAGIGEVTAVPEPGDKVRLILRGQSFAEWIQAKKDHGQLMTGDVVTQTTDHGQAYDAQGQPHGPKLTTQAQVDAVPRAQTLGIYGPINLRKPTPAETQWVEAADAAHHDAVVRTPIVEDDDAPF
jgi:hypothetical protein